MPTPTNTSPVSLSGAISGVTNNLPSVAGQAGATGSGSSGSGASGSSASPGSSGSASPPSSTGPWSSTSTSFPSTSLTSPSSSTGTGGGSAAQQGLSGALSSSSLAESSASGGASGTSTSPGTGTGGQGGSSSPTLTPSSGPVMAADGSMLARPVGGGTGGVFGQAWKLMPAPPYSAPYGGGPGAASDDQTAFGTLDALILSYIDANLANLTIPNTSGSQVTGSAPTMAVTASDGFGSYTFSAEASWTFDSSYTSGGAFSTSDTEILTYSINETGYSPDGTTFNLTDAGHATLSISSSSGSGGQQQGGAQVRPGGGGPGGSPAMFGGSGGGGGGSGNSLTHYLYDNLIGSDNYDFKDYEDISTSGSNDLNESDTLNDAGTDSFTLSETQTEYLNTGGSITSGTDTYQWNYAGR